MRSRFLWSFWLFVSATSTLSAAEITVSIPDKTSDGAETIYISLQGDIDPGDFKKFSKELEAAQKAVYLRSHPDDPDMVSSPNPYLETQLELNSRNGGDFRAALDIAELVRSEGITTVVKKGSVCTSACAFIFLAGESHQPYSEVVGRRILEPGGYVFFHSPYIRGRFGTFSEGRKAVRRLLEVLGPRLSSELAVEILFKEPNEYLSIDTVGDAIKWEVTLEKFRAPWPRRAGLLQACINYFNAKDILFGEVAGLKNPYPIVPSVPVRERRPDDVDVGPFNPAQNVEEEPILDPLTALETSLLPEGSEELQIFRKNFDTDGIMRLVRLSNGEVASQFQFIGDGMVSCTVWGGFRRLIISRNRHRHLTSQALEAEVTRGRVAYVPFWYQFPPETLLSSISGEF